ncbi:hypothetical protein BDR07DRAFT_1463415 [Suillus spraguei]|nr:hypothetical protein BDR07DRAFT_1463415 [Suillus spraguei]
MNVFNPRILDASIRDVTECLLTLKKLMFCSTPCSICRSKGPELSWRMLFSRFSKSRASISRLARALLLRAKSRLAAGYRTSAQQDLLFVLSSDPANQDAKAIIQSEHLRREMEPDGPPRFSAEVWRKIALYLPKPYFREIDLHFTASPGPNNRYKDVLGGHDEQELDAWHYQRSADILTRILVDTVFASHIRSLSVYAIVSDASHILAFKTGLC